MTTNLPLSTPPIPDPFDPAFRGKYAESLINGIEAGQNSIVRQDATYHIVNVEDKTYTLDMNARYPYNIEDITYKTDAGICTIAVKINGTDVGALGALSVTSTEQTTAATTDKAVAVGDDVTLVVSSVTGVADLIINVWFDRTGVGTA